MDVYNIQACVWLFCGAYGCGVQFAGCNLRRAGCEMLSLILELQTGQLDFCFAQVVTIHCTNMSFSRFVALYCAN